MLGPSFAYDVSEMTAPPQQDDTKRVLSIVGQLVFVIGAAFVVYCFVAVTREGEARRVCTAPCLLRADYMAAERRAPAWTVKDEAGKDVSSKDYEGKVLVLNFWTKTCAPCMEEMPELAEMSAIVATTRPDVAVVAISTDENPQEALTALRGAVPRDFTKMGQALKGFSSDVPFRVLFDPDSKTVFGKFGTKLFPETWVIDKKGVIRARFDGPRPWTNSAFIEFLDQLRRGDYCPVDIKLEPTSEPEKRRKITGKEAALCQSIGG